MLQWNSRFFTFFHMQWHMYIMNIVTPRMLYYIVALMLGFSSFAVFASVTVNSYIVALMLGFSSFDVFASPTLWPSCMVWVALMIVFASVTVTSYIVALMYGLSSFDDLFLIHLYLVICYAVYCMC